MLDQRLKCSGPNECANTHPALTTTPVYEETRVMAEYDSKPGISDDARQKRSRDNCGRAKCRRLYKELGDCELCGKPATDRHHKNGNTQDNSPDNIQRLCRSCHMKEDGRGHRLTEHSKRRKLNRQVNPRPCKPCAQCAREVKQLRRGLCISCYERSRMVKRLPDRTRVWRKD